MKRTDGQDSGRGAVPLRRGQWFSLVVAAVLALGGIAPGLAAEAPVLQIETGGHSNIIRGLAFSRDGSHLYSAGYDKVVRVWDLASGTTSATLRGRITDQQTGDAYALALSPDDATLAVGGFMEAPCDGDTCGSVYSCGDHCGDIRLFDARSGAVTGLLQDRANITLSLSFSANGRLLASGHGDFTARIWDVTERRQVARFATNRKGSPGSIRVALMPDGASVAVVARTKAVEMFTVGDQLPARRLTDEQTLAGDEVLTAVAVSEDGQLVAAASDKGTVLAWSWPDGRLKTVVAGNGASVTAMVFGHGPTARIVVTAPGRATPERRYVTRIVDLGSGAVREFEAHDNVSQALAVTADGTRVASAGGNDKSIHVWSAVAPAQGQKLLGHGRTVMAVGFLTDTATGRESLAWGYVDPCPGEPSCPERNGVLQYAMTLPTLAGGARGSPRLIAASPAAAGGTAPATVAHQAEIAAPAGRLTRQQYGTTSYFPTLSLDSGDKQTLLSRRDDDEGRNHRAYSFDPAKRSVATGGNNGALTILGLDGSRLKTMSQTSGDIFCLAYNADGRLLATGSSDQTVRLWNPATGRLVVSMIHTNDGEWAIWTPQGYFAASPHGETLVGWQINHGRDKAGERITGNEVRQVFYRPELVERAIAMASAEDAVEEARKGGTISDFTLDMLREHLPPEFKIIDPPPLPQKKRTGERDLGVTIAWPAGRPPIERFDIFVNSNRIDPRDYTATPVSDGGQSGLRFSALRLKGGSNTIRIKAYAGNLETEKVVEVVYQGPPGVEERDTLYVVAIGINTYPHLANCPGSGDGSCNLRFADRDAREFASTIKDRMVGSGRGHARIVSRVLYSGAGGDNEPNRQNITEAMKLFEKARSNDTSVLFVAGHGDNNGGYQLLSADARMQGSRWDPASVIPWHDLQGTLAKAAGRRLMFVDTCRAVRFEANSAYGRSIINDGQAQEIIVFTSTSPDQEALEIDDLRHGAFTAQLIKGINGDADIWHSYRITLTQLNTYLQHFVGELTAEAHDGFRQAPQYFIPPTLNDFVLVYLARAAARASAAPAGQTPSESRQ